MTQSFPRTGPMCLTSAWTSAASLRTSATVIMYFSLQAHQKLALLVMDHILLSPWSASNDFTTYIDSYCSRLQESCKLADFLTSSEPITSFLKMTDKRNNDDFSKHTRIWAPRIPLREGWPWQWRPTRYRRKRSLHTVLIDRHQMET